MIHRNDGLVKYRRKVYGEKKVYEINSAEIVDKRVDSEVIIQELEHIKELIREGDYSTALSNLKWLEKMLEKLI